MNSMHFNVETKIDLSLPARIRTRGGAEFDPRSNIWQCRDCLKDVRVDFSQLPLAADLMLAVKKTLIWYVENKSIDYFSNIFYYLKKFLTSEVTQATLITSIRSEHIINYHAKLSKRNKYYLGSLCGFLKKLYNMNLKGIEYDAISLLEQMRLPGNEKGEAVLTLDPENGPFSDVEFHGLFEALENAYRDRKVELDEYLLVSLFLALGQRPIQYAGLKVCDFSVSTSSAGIPIYVLRMPRAKQRNKTIRSEFKNRVLTPRIGEKLCKHASQIKKQFINVLSDPAQAPLFPRKNARKNTPTGYENHQTSQSLAATLSAVIDRLQFVSERTGKVINANAYRFRRTLATRAAAEGHGELVIAELLDHKDTQNVGIYIEAVPMIIERIESAVSHQLAPLARAFAGVIITDESEAPYPGDPAHRVCDPRFDPSMKPIGSCGKHGYCDSMAPLACYTCRSFHPWADAPHETVMNYLTSERERLLATCDVRVASINDRTILAVSEVVRQCELIHKDKKES